MPRVARPVRRVLSQGIRCMHQKPPGSNLPDGNTSDSRRQGPTTSASQTSADDAHAGWMPSMLAQLTQWACINPRTTLAIVAILSIVCLGITGRFLTFKTNRSDLINPQTAFHQRWLRYVELFGDQGEVLIVIEGQDRQSIETAMDSVGSALESQPELFDRVMYRFDPGLLQSKALQYLPPADLEHLIAQLEMYGPILDGHWDRAGLESYAQRLAGALSQVSNSPLATASAGPDPLPADATAVPAEVHAIIEQSRLLCRSLNQFAHDPRAFESPWPSALPPAMETQADHLQVRYQINDAGTMGFVLAVPSGTQDFSGGNHSLSRLREIVREYDDKHPEVSIGLTGIPVLESDEMLRSQQDMAMASIISFVGVGLILLIGFRGFRHPLLSLLTLAIGIIWSLGYTTIAVGHLNILSVSFAAILIGLGIDFAIHYLAKYLEFRHHDLELTPALMATSSSVGTGIVTAAVTTSLAFLCAMFTQFLGVAELGIIAGGGILICAATTFLVLPALVSLSDRSIEPRRLPTPFEGRLIRYLTGRFPAMVCLITLAAIIGTGLQGFEWSSGEVHSRVKYDSNLLNLQARGIDSVELQHRLFEESNGSLLYAVSLAGSPYEVRQRKDQFLELPSVGRVEELASYLPKYPAAETKLLIQAIHARLSRLSRLPSEYPQLDPKTVGAALENLYLQIRERKEPEAVAAAHDLDEFLDRLNAPEVPETVAVAGQIELLGRYQQAMLTALHAQFSALAKISDPNPMTPADLPHALRSRFLSSNGDWLIRVYPREQIWEEAPLEEFVTEVRTIDPEITGTPLQNYEAARQIRHSYFNASIYALAVILLTLLIDAMHGMPLVVTLGSPLAVLGFMWTTLEGAQDLPIRNLVIVYVVVAVIVAAIFDFVSVRNTFLALMPPVLGLFLMFGILGLTGIDLNPANLIVLPLILGIGVDDGVHVIHDYRMQRGTYRTSPSTINAITLTSLTSMVGFGSMMVSAHQGLVSLGIVLVVGVGSCLFISLVTLPALLTLVGAPHGGTEPDAASATAGPMDQSGDSASPHVLPLRRTRDSA